jgi:hypothetical protein
LTPRPLRHLIREEACITWHRSPPRQELAEADGMRAFRRVVNAYRRRDTLALSKQPELAVLKVGDGVAYVPIERHLEPRVIDGVPIMNLETDASQRAGEVGRGPQRSAASDPDRHPWWAEQCHDDGIDVNCYR